jgi:hypothetical protein
MSPHRRNRFLFVSLTVLAVLGVGEARLILDERAQLSSARARTTTLDAEIAALRRSGDTTQRDLAEAERELAALPSIPGAEGKNDSPQAAERQAWFARVRRLKRIFAEQPGQRIPEMKLLEEFDWLLPTQYPIETEPQLRMALARVREAARARFRPQMAAALWKYGSSKMPASILALAPYFDPPVDPAMIQQYELVERRATTSGGVTVELAFQNRAPVDEMYEYHSEFNANMSGTYGGSPTSWVPDYEARSQRALVVYARDHPTTAHPPLRELAPYFDPPLAAAVVDGFEAFVREQERQR